MALCNSKTIRISVVKVSKSCGFSKYKTKYILYDLMVVRPRRQEILGKRSIHAAWMCNLYDIQVGYVSISCTCAFIARLPNVTNWCVHYFYEYL